MESEKKKRKKKKKIKKQEVEEEIIKEELPNDELVTLSEKIVNEEKKEKPKDVVEEGDS